MSRSPSVFIKDYIRKFEALVLVAYLCPAKVWTIGYGTTVYPDGLRVAKGDMCTRDEAEDYFRKDLTKFSKSINFYVKVFLTQNQFDALVSLVYNIGTTNFNKSTLLRVLNLRQYSKASEQFLVWCKARDRRTGKLKTLRGLQIRRKKEQEIFDTLDNVRITMSYLDKIKIRACERYYRKRKIFNIKLV